VRGVTGERERDRALVGAAAGRLAGWPVAALVVRE
jgi:hypothetical protein